MAHGNKAGLVVESYDQVGDSNPPNILAQGTDAPKIGWHHMVSGSEAVFLHVSSTSDSGGKFNAFSFGSGRGNKTQNTDWGGSWQYASMGYIRNMRINGTYYGQNVFFRDSPGVTARDLIDVFVALKDAVSSVNESDPVAAMSSMRSAITATSDSLIQKFEAIHEAVADELEVRRRATMEPPEGVDGTTPLAMAALTALSLAGCATQKGNDRHAQHAADQIRMVAVQREAMVQEAKADAESNAALVEALAEVARTSPESANAAVVALAVIGVSGAGESESDTPVIGLQQQRSEALEWTKALAPTVGGLVTGLGVAAINADVTKNAQDANRDIQINDANSDVAIVKAVAGLGTAAANSVGTDVGGDYYSVTDQGTLDQSVNTADSNNTTTTTETTNTTSTEVSLNTTLNYDGQGITLSDLITQLKNAGATYSIDIDGDGTPDVEGGDGTTPPIVINCDKPQFSPAPPECANV
jgi:hypothetical protein